ncbi:hypothetical protein KOM07_03295 [Lentilactobacillus sp. G22-6]|uniref:hypothetical protein n=1 Tax=Lentilactobacillus dabitei TaxID=2831523 RepID=UPI001C27231B|nr:hypothetical protein [Lentilactobacillus dabitei]MBU9788586.1 hypothetical protein [Lentilactobacillus dabitei]
MEVRVNLDNLDSAHVVEAVVKQLVPVITDEVAKKLDERYQNETLTKEQVAREVFKCNTETFDKYYSDCPHLPQGSRTKYNRAECIKYFKKHQVFAGEM